MKILTINGWSLPHDGLLELFPNAAVSDYSAHENLDSWLAAHAKDEPWDLVVGWSLGGHLAMEALRRDVIKTSQLVLMSAPLQFVRNDHLADAMPRPTFAQFKKNYDDDSRRTATRFAALTAMGDAAEYRIKQKMPSVESMADKARWQHWLHYLEHASHVPHALDTVPPTLIIHGAQDAIVPVAQARHWHAKLPGSELLLLPKAGHAPHWHDADLVRQAIEQFAMVAA